MVFPLAVKQRHLAATATNRNQHSASSPAAASAAASYWDDYYSLGKRPRTSASATRPRPYSNSSCHKHLTVIAAILLVLYAILSGYAYSTLQQHQQQQQGNHKNPFLVPPTTTLHKQQQHQQRIPPGPPQSTHDDNQISWDIEAITRHIQQHGASSWHLPITAYLEPLWPVSDYGTRGDPHIPKDRGTPPTFLWPNGPQALQRVEYHQVQSCRDLPHKLPTDGGFDATVTNVGKAEAQVTPPREYWNRTAQSQSISAQELPCPVDMDPFLPWIHDVFPSLDGRQIHVISQNKRKCHSGFKSPNYEPFVQDMIPQAALMQPVSVQRISPTTPNASFRYRLAPRHLIPQNQGHNYTRFICRFTTRTLAKKDDSSDPNAKVVVVGETLSDYEFNYELASYRKKEFALWTPRGQDSKLFWTSNIRFACPVPSHLRERIAKGEMVFSVPVDHDENKSLLLPLLYLDIIPIRTPARYHEHYLGEELIGPSPRSPGFNATLEWGEDGRELPPVEASGRWTNLPICAPPRLVTTETGPSGRVAADLATPEAPTTISQTGAGTAARPLADFAAQTTVNNKRNKPHFLSACLWASAEFKTRGVQKGGQTDTSSRLVEWIEFHLLVGLDHFYIYDNSGAHSNVTSLRPVLEPYIQAGVVTYIEWPSQICNNNIPAHDSTGERSTQYAAENSCRTRFAPFTEWLISFDTDEYLVPMGQHTSMKTVLQQAHEKTGLNIMSFRSSRGRMRVDMSQESGKGRDMLPNVTYLQAYNCDGAGSPKPEWAERARKQAYLADYVLYHFVHYSTVTQGYLESYQNSQDLGQPFQFNFREHPPSERPSNELTEAVMVHTKTITHDQTLAYQSHCHYNWTKKWMGCWVGYPWPDGKQNAQDNHTSDGMEYNCFINENLEQYWIPKLQQALLQRKQQEEVAV